MMSLLINKKTAFLFVLVLQFIFINYAMAVTDGSLESIVIKDVNPNYIYNRGSRFYVTYEIKNTGTELIYARTYTARIYAGEYQIGYAVGQEQLQIDEVKTNTISGTLPNDIPYGFYTIRGKVSFDYDTNSRNNTASFSPDIIVAPTFSTSGADMWVLSVSPLVNVVNPSGEIAFNCFVVNIGNETSDSYTINFFVGNSKVGSVSCGPLDSGQIYSINNTGAFAVPSDIPEGYYVVKAEIVCTNENITNNNIGQAAERIKVDAPYTDLLVNNILFTGNKFRQGDSVNVVASIMNISTCNAQNIYAECYIGDYLAGNSYHDDLGPEQSDNILIECQIPENLPDGYYNMRVVVTCSDDVDTSNNLMISDTTIWIGEYADLEVKSFQAKGGTYQPKDMIEIYSLIENVGDGISNPYTIDYYMSTDKNITAMDYRIGRIERKSLEPGSQHSYNTIFKLPPNLPVGNYYIGAIVRCVGEGNLVNNTGLDNETVGIIHPANYVCGHITYEYTGQNNQAVRFALLKIIDAGTDRVIAQTYTDENGNYGEVVLRDEMSPGNVYVKVYAESVIGAYPGTRSKICSVRSDADKHLYSRQSPNYSHTQNSSRIIDYTIPISGRAIMVFDSMVEAFINAKEYFGIEMEPITTYWPSNNKGTYYYPGEGIFIGIDDEWDRDVILHEYGHYIAEVYGFCQGNVGENPNHAWDVDLREFPVQRTAEHAANLAFRESWPTLFSIASQYYNSLYPRSGDTKYHDYYSYYNWSYELDLEEDTFDKGSTGEFYENMNCCALWDIFDNHPDNISFSEEISDPNLSKTWSVIRGYKPEDMNDFWVGWFHHFGQNEDKDGIIDILQEHRMSFAQSGIVPQVPKNHAPVANAGQDKTVAQDRTEGALVHLSASGSSDSDGDALSYVWRYGYISYSGEQVDIVLPAGRNEIELEVSDGKITTWDTIVVTVTPTNPGT